MKLPITFSLTKKENIWGFGYLAFQFLVLPLILSLVNEVLPTPMDSAQLNICYYVINFVAVAWIFRGFLAKNIDALAQRPVQVLKAVIFGFARYIVLSALVGNLVLMLDPEFMNANDSAIIEMAEGNFLMMTIGTVVLVPVVEECLFRGLIFRNLYDRGTTLAYLVSVVAFASVHIVNFLFVYSPTEILISFLQYVPAGLCLAWAYTRADTIFAPILIHTIVNAIGMYSMR